MDEFGAIARYFAPLAAGEPGALGLTDDAAVLRPTPGTVFVLTKDVMVADVHFLASDPPDLVARKLLRVNLSDLAAMGAKPRAYLAGLTLPQSTEEAWIAAFAKGLAQDQVEFGITLVGGDTTSHRGPLVVSLTAIGEMEEGRELRRSRARAGDLVCVSGTLGDAALGLRALRGELPYLSAADRQALEGRYHLPRPRVALGPALVGLATAAIDVSDGLLADLGHIAETSGCAATVHRDRLPLSTAAAHAVSEDPALMADVLGGGDDYELLFTVPPTARPKVAALAEATSLALTVIGEMWQGEGVELVDEKGAALPKPERRGWTHF